MFGSDALEVAIGLVFVYLLFSLICSTLTEFVARIFRIRPNMLENAIRNMIAGSTPDRWQLGDQFYDLGLVKSLSKRSPMDHLFGRAARPSYIPARVFVQGLFDTLTRPGPDHLFWREVQQLQSATAQTGLEQILQDLWDDKLNLRMLQKPKNKEQQQGRQTVIDTINRLVTDKEDRAIKDTLLKIVDGEEISSNTAAARHEDQVRGEILNLVDNLPDGKEKTSLVKFLDSKEPAGEIRYYDIQSTARRNFVQLREAANSLDSSLPLRQILLQVLDSSEERAESWNDALSQARLETEIWFEDVMDRVTGWYRRKASYIVLIWAVAVTVMFNVDTLAIGSALYSEATLRETVSSAAAAYVSSRSAPTPVDENVANILNVTISPTGTVASQPISMTFPSSPTVDSELSAAVDGATEDPGQPALDELRQEIESLGLPIGWVNIVEGTSVDDRGQPLQATAPATPTIIFHLRNMIVTDLHSGDAMIVGIEDAENIMDQVARAKRYRQQWPRTGEERGKKVAGLLLTIVALSLGAPFWFDVLGRLASLRAAGKPPAAGGAAAQGTKSASAS